LKLPKGLSIKEPPFLSVLDNSPLIANVFYGQPLTWQLCTNLNDQLCTNLNDLKISCVINRYIKKVFNKKCRVVAMQKQKFILLFLLLFCFDDNSLCSLKSRLGNLTICNYYVGVTVQDQAAEPPAIKFVHKCQVRLIQYQYITTSSFKSKKNYLFWSL